MFCNRYHSKHYKNAMTKKLSFIFIRAFLIITCHTCNIFFITNKMYLYAVIIGMLISLLWTINVRDISIATWHHRLAYVLGGTVGTIVSLYYITDLFI